ncbi:hypothetical protein A3A76_04315 [Candidatus Woesebacteria bacterium RIFCSPLOWO2_01_FULL_39_23]|uniref:Uncharacterized protein n=1 Tax=Candidatus Woesebacteria bacterium RIFCSPHIGHO2_01_FULL_40_22 TaxID=1802499 RepID=A0A1F7YF69_9BACT|nr:MAG: hypothetical protein A2141_01880 [Candidatus Woesebacteria bacterium RBG_16_40_11]OGM25976.1 MAG: hypothetical protein A2628_00315 [Candidatus Woesebacteria bacterium RIFCSPHIGHO2_01_FULL_40_22]OGM38088.1 MAG: hypothetical protein A3E41_03400 [Candidatus Woesebacteria bacterium RIFCSPHIGHO2_12_FULL_38_9]OGM61825.1 MAG: hypothetical protein A3A76_04315 [Candidatus Woesebacteria bacterium RIFCSPLOWO2_01_FULL_39_23]
MNENSEKIDEFTLSREILNLIDSYKEAGGGKKNGSIESTIKVSQVLGPLAFFYERVRNALEYKGEHLIKRNAIERMLRRQIWERRSHDPKILADTLIKELIWARYVKNDSVPKRKLTLISKIIAKYLKIFAALSRTADNYNYTDLKDWLLGIFSCEIEEVLDSSYFYKEALNYAVFSWFKKNYEWLDGGLSQKEKETQIFIAVHRSLSKSDKAGIRYRLLKVYYPSWIEMKDEEFPVNLEKLINSYREIEKEITSPYQSKMYRFVQRQSAAFLVLREVIGDNPELAMDVINKPQKLEAKIKEVCSNKYSQIRRRVNRGILRSIIYIFLTKVLLAILIEAPYEIFFKDRFNVVPILINVMFPPFLMFLVGLSIRKPDEDNTQRIITIINSFVYSGSDSIKQEFSLVSNTGGGLIYRIFFVIYSLLFLLTFGGISLILFDLGFNIMSAGIFFVFISLVLLFAYRIRYTAGELSVRGEKESFMSHMITNLALPLLNLGSWLSQGLQKFNFLLLFMDFLIEAPLKNIIRVFEEWTSFIKEKREEVVEVPN